MKTFQQFMEQSKLNMKANFTNTTNALQGMKDNKTINAIQNQLKSGKISIPGIKNAVGDGKDLKNLKFNILSNILKDASAGVEKVQTKINKMK